MPHDPSLAGRLRRIAAALDTMDPLPRRVFELHCMNGVDFAGIPAAGRSCTFCALPVSLANPEAGCAR